MKIKQSSSIAGYTIVLASSKLPDYFDSIAFDNVVAKVFPCYGYGENTFAVKGTYDLTGKTIEFLNKGKPVSI